MTARDPIEAAVGAFWHSLRGAGYWPGQEIADDMRAAIAAYLRAQAEAYKSKAEAVMTEPGRTAGDVARYRQRMAWCRELAAEVERGEKG